MYNSAQLGANVEKGGASHDKFERRSISRDPKQLE